MGEGFGSDFNEVNLSLIFFLHIFKIKGIGGGPGSYLRFLSFAHML